MTARDGLLIFTTSSIQTSGALQVNMYALDTSLVLIDRKQITSITHPIKSIQIFYCNVGGFQKTITALIPACEDPTLFYIDISDIGLFGIMIKDKWWDNRRLRGMQLVANNILVFGEVVSGTATSNANNKAALAIIKF